MIRATFILASLLLPSTAALAVPAPQKIHEKDGYRFVYSTQMLRDGVIEINGHMADSGARFRYIVARSGVVSGEHDGVPLRFSVGKSRRDRLAASLDPAPMLAATSTGPAPIAVTLGQ